MPAKAKKSAGDDEALASFTAICHVAKKLMVAGRMKVRILYPSRVDLRIAKDDLEAAAAEEGLSVAECQRVLDAEIAPLMAAELSGDFSVLGVLASMRFGDGPGNFDAARAKVAARSKVVVQELVTQRLRDRYLLKQTSKTNPLTGWHWEISAKEYDDGKGPLASLRHVTVRFHAHRRTGRYDEASADYFPSLVKVQPVEAFSFDCDLEEAEDLHDVFGRIVRELKSREASPPETEATEEGVPGEAERRPREG